MLVLAAAAASKFSSPQASARCVEGHTRFALTVGGGGTGLNIGLSAWCSRFWIAGLKDSRIHSRGLLGRLAGCTWEPHAVGGSGRGEPTDRLTTTAFPTAQSDRESEGMSAWRDHAPSELRPWRGGVT